MSEIEREARPTVGVVERATVPRNLNATRFDLAVARAASGNR